jgi:hypothetical protein
MAIHKLYLRVFLIAFFIFLCACYTSAQPYYYYPKFVDEYHGYATIARINMSTGVDEDFLLDTLKTASIDWDPTQRFLFVWPGIDEGQMTIIPTDNPQNHILLPADKNIPDVLGWYYLSPKNKLYLATRFDNYIYDASTFSLLDSVSHSIMTVGPRTFASQDGEYLYFGRTDTTTGYNYFETISTTSHTLISRKREYYIGPPKEFKLPEDGKNGKALFGMLYPTDNLADAKIFVYDALHDSTMPLIPFPPRSIDCLSTNGDYIIVEESPFDEVSTTREDVHLGNIYVFKTATGKLMQRLALPPGGSVYIFDNYPNNAYYYDDSTKQTITIDLTVITPISNLIGYLDSTVTRVHDSLWVTNETFVTYLDSNLIAARNYIVAGDSNNCARQIKLFQQKVDSAYKDSLNPNRHVTIEGWKYLYYNAQYILDRLPTPPPQYNLNLNTIGNGTITPSPEYTLYDSATTVTPTATAGTGYKFSGWSGDAVGTTNPISVLMNSEKTITATFVKE